MSQKQFKNLNFFTIQFPFTAIISILHRLSGIFIYLIIPFLLWILDVAIGSEEGFNEIHNLFSSPGILLLIWLILIAFWYHLFAGIRHLLMDIGLGENLKLGKISGVIVVILTIIFLVLTGIRLW